MIERKVIIVTDAGADLPSTEILRSQYNVGPIPTIPLSISFGLDNYVIGENIDNENLKV